MAKMALRQRPYAAFLLMLSGGIVIFLWGLLTAAFGIAIASLAAILSSALGFAALGIFSAVVGIIMGIIITYCSFRVYAKSPVDVKEWAIIAMLCSIISLVDLGGLGIGFLLAFIGSILAVTYNN